MTQQAMVKQEKIDFNEVEPGYIELGYISPDWKVWEDEDLQQICVEMAANFLEIECDNIQKAFYWAEDRDTNSKHLFVKLDCVPDVIEPTLEKARGYMCGFFDGIGY